MFQFLFSLFPPSCSLILFFSTCFPSPCSSLHFHPSLASVIFFDCLGTCFFLSNSSSLRFPVIFSSLCVSFLLHPHHLSLVSITARACKCRGSTNVALQHAPPRWCVAPRIDPSAGASVAKRGSRSLTSLVNDATLLQDFSPLTRF